MQNPEEELDRKQFTLLVACVWFGYVAAGASILGLLVGMLL